MTPIGNGQLLVEYDVVGPNTSALTQIKINGLTVVYSDVVSGGDSVSITFTVPTRNNAPREVDIYCELRRIDGTLIVQNVCTVMIEDG